MAVRVEIEGRRIFLRSSYATPGLKEVLPGATFSKVNGPHWSLPLSLETCALLRQRFGHELEIGPRLWGWAKAEKERRAEALALASASDAEITRLYDVAPKLAKAMEARPYQRPAVRFIADFKQVLIGDTVGFGKTAEALGGILESGLDGPFLVVTSPKLSVTETWEAEIHRWLPDDEFIGLPEGRAARDRVLDHFRSRQPASLARTWVVTHPEAIRTKAWWICLQCGSKTRLTSKPKQLVCDHDPRDTKTELDHEFPQLFLSWPAVIADESDKALIRLSGTQNQTRMGMEILRDRQQADAIRVAMSGTPWRSRAQLLWSTLNWLRPKEYTGFWNWAKLYWELGGYTGYEIKSFRADREEMLWRSLDKIVLRRTRAEVRDDLPVRNYIGQPVDPDDEGSPLGIWLPMEGKQEKAYRSMADTTLAQLETGTLDAVGVLAQMTRLRQFASSYGTVDAYGEFHPSMPSNKFDYLVKLLTDLGFPHSPITKVLVTSQFTQLLELFDVEIKKVFKGLSTAMLTGNVPEARRRAAKRAFDIEGQAPFLMFLNVNAGGRSLTLDAAEEYLALDETWVDDDREQAEGRIDNRNPEKKIVQRNYRYVRSRGTIDEGMARDNAASREMTARLLDGRRGVEYARKLVEC